MNPSNGFKSDTYMYFRYYMMHADNDPRTITKAGKDFAKELDFKDIKFTVKIRAFLKIINKRFLIKKGKNPIYVSKKYC